jgi:predicted DNA-binding transcriptional regulator AlpA
MRLIGYEEARQKLGVKIGTLYSWVCQKKGPPFIRLSARCVRFDEEALDQWLRERVYVPTDEPRVIAGKVQTNLKTSTEG